jgi:pimeloyl-ACP methyl ester carboxylesterase
MKSLQATINTKRLISRASYLNPLRLSWLGPAITSLFLAACGGAGDEKNRPPIDARSTLAFGPCAVQIADSAAICGTLNVPEERSEKNSRLIGLPFVVLPAKSSGVKDPIAFIPGGPGPSPLQGIAALPADLISAFPLRQNRDFIVLTHRGTDLTTPFNLDCDELVRDVEAGQRFASQLEIVSSAQMCRDRLVAKGAKLHAYTTKEIAQDLEDLRVLLGAERGFTQWNLVGSSFGSKVALTIMRDNPVGVRSAVLDGPVPLQRNFLYSLSGLDGLGAVLDACKAQTACAAAYPDLQASFAAVIERLEVSPTTVNGTVVRGRDLLVILQAVLAQAEPSYNLIPLFMQKITQDDLAGADEVIPYLARISVPFFNFDVSSGMAYAVLCTDDAGRAAATTSQLPAGGTGWSEGLRRLYAKTFLGDEISTCPVWVKGTLLTTEDQRALRSDIPSLITVGQFDGSTSNRDADQLIPDLSRARKIVFTGRGHSLVASDFCMLTITASFIDNPQATINTSCVDPVESLRFELPALATARN